MIRLKREFGFVRLAFMDKLQNDFAYTDFNKMRALALAREMMLSLKSSEQLKK